MKKEAMQITLTADQTQRLRDWASANCRAEIEADCIPSGFGLEVSILPGVHAQWVEAVYGPWRLDLGDVDVQYIEVEG